MQLDSKVCYFLGQGSSLSQFWVEDPALIKPLLCWVKPGAARLDQMKFDLILFFPFFGKSFGASFIKTQTWLHAVIAQLENNKSYKQVCCLHAWSNDLCSFTQNFRARVCFYSYVFGSQCNKLRKCGVPIECQLQWKKRAYAACWWTGLPFQLGSRGLCCTTGVSWRRQALPEPSREGCNMAFVVPFCDHKFHEHLQFELIFLMAGWWSMSC